jgi:nucleotide-binding universal stress UspA family protein
MSTQSRAVVAGVGRVEAEDPILRPALETARRLGATLYLVHAFRLPDPLLDAYAGMGLLNAQEQQRALLSSLEDVIRGLAPDARIVCRVVPGAADLAISNLLDEVDADLVMLGASHGGPVARAILGTTAQRLLRGARTPVLVADEAFPERIGSILLTTDLSTMSLAVHDRAMEIIHDLWRADIPELHSLLVLSAAAELPRPLRKDLLAEVGERELQTFLLKPRNRLAPVKGAVRFGDPAREIVAEAEDSAADLLVLGTHSRTGVHAMLLGSVAEAVLRRAQCSVLVIPAAAVREPPTDIGGTE